MMASKSLEQHLGVNPFGKKVEVDKIPEAMQEVEFVADETIERAIAQYESILNANIVLFNSRSGRLLMDENDERISLIKDRKIEILAPEQINIFFRRLSFQYERTQMEGEVTSAFMTKLICESYNAGHNNFILTTNDIMIRSLGEYLTGKENNPLNMEIRGNVGKCLGAHSKYCTYTILGDAGDLSGISAENCIYAVHGNVKASFGVDSKECVHYIKGNAGYKLGGNSKKSTYIIYGNVGDDCGAGSLNCTFDLMGQCGNFVGERSRYGTYKTHDQKTYLSIASVINVPNTVQLIDDKGKIINKLERLSL